MTFWSWLTAVSEAEDDDTEPPDTIIPETPGLSSSASTSRLTESLASQVMSLNSKVHALHLQKLEAENMVVRIAVDKLQVEREKERDEILWKAKTETLDEQRLVAEAKVACLESLVPPEDKMVRLGGKKFSQPRTLEEFKERARRDKKNAKEFERKKRRLAEQAQSGWWPCKSSLKMMALYSRSMAL